MARRNIWFALFLGWMVPGLGHFFVKQHPRGLLYSVCICGLYAAGMLLSGGTAVNWDIHPWYFACQFWAGPITLALEYLRGPEAIFLGESIGILEHQTGVVWAAVAGALNLVTLGELYRRHSEPDAPGPADTMRSPSPEATP
ncbi:MAG: hypothetical protein KF754_09630 [Planctomycetes bacterium]|nr:hypothetical protein [Planctomycetota bacterium]